MGKQSGKRHTSAGNPVSDVKANGQVEASPTVNDGNGQDGATGLKASGNDSAESKTDYSGLVTYAELEYIVDSHNQAIRTDYIVRAWYPKINAWITTNGCDVLVQEGKASYQLSTGEIVEL